MKMIKRISFLGLLMASLAFTSCKNQPTDAELLTEVNKELGDEAGGQGVTASVAAGVVTLTGTCKDDKCRAECADEVKDVKGVKSVVNNIQIAAAVPATTTAPVEIATDNVLTTSVNNAVAGYNKVKAEVNDGVVTLRGEITRSELPELLQKINALKVKKIENQLVIK